jgi:chemotaxis protein MotB
MRNVSSILLTVLLTVALVLGLLLYILCRDTGEALLLSQEKVAQLNRRVNMLSEELRKAAQQSEEAERAQGRISKLEQEVAQKTRSLSKCNDINSTLREGLLREGQINVHLSSEIASKDASLNELWKSLKDDQSRIRFLEEEVAKSHSDIEKLQEELSSLKGKKTMAERQVHQLKTAYESLISDLKQQIGDQEVTIKAYEEKISVTMVDHILFEFGMAAITPEGKDILQRVGEVLSNIRDRTIRVVGHTDNIPITPPSQYRFPTNWELSAARAAAVVRHFQNESGIDPRTLEAVGRSLYDPVAINQTAEGRAQNRRVEIIIAPKLE